MPKRKLDEVEKYEMKDDEERHEALNEDKLLAQRLVAGPPANCPHEYKVVNGGEHRGEYQTRDCDEK